MTGYFIQAFIYLVAAVSLVPLAKKLGLGSVLGYLIAGVIIGPALGLVAEEAASSVQHFAEFGVVMMLFLIGMELQPAALWGIRHRLFGLGGLQVILTTLAIASVGRYLLHLDWGICLVVGMILSLSSTAIVLQTLAEKNLSRGEGGGSAFSVLLFQDIAVIPMLAIIPFLALPEAASVSAGLAEAGQVAHDAESGHGSWTLVAHLPVWGKTLAVMASIGLLVLGGRFLVRPLFHYVAESDSREVFTATALLLMVGVSVLMSLVGLSPALGAFLAGVLLASSEFRHELESDLEPFKGLLLGLFFMTVGAGVDFALLWEELGTILLLTLSLMLLKCVLLWLLGFIFRLPRSDRWLFAFSLAQAGEFGFVLLTYAANQNALTADDAQLLALVVALSMFLTPGLFILLERVIFPRLAEKPATHHQEDIDRGPVIIAGVGRFGQVVNRLLVSNGFQTVLLDHKASQIELMRRINVKGYFGDATRPDMLETAGIEEASLLVLAMDERQSAIKLVHHVKRNYPQVQIIARAFDRRHLYELRDAGADFCISETYYSALEMGAEALRRMGYADIVAEQRKQAFNDTEAKFRDELYASWRNKGEGRGIDDHYRGVVIRLQEALYETMQQASHDDKRDAANTEESPESLQTDAASSSSASDAEGSGRKVV